MGGVIPSKNLNDYCYLPNAKIIDFCKKKNTNICFPKGIKEKYNEFNNLVARRNQPNSEIDPLWAKKNLKNVVLQGGLNPNILLKSEEEIIKGSDEIHSSI